MCHITAFGQPLSALLSAFSVRRSRNPYLFAAGIAYPVLFPCALTVFAFAAHRHRRHLSTAVWAVVCDLSCIRTLTTPVSGKRHPHPTAGTLRSVCFIYSPLSHFQHHPILTVCRTSGIFQPAVLPPKAQADACNVGNTVCATRQSCRPVSISYRGKTAFSVQPFLSPSNVIAAHADL